MFSIGSQIFSGKWQEHAEQLFNDLIPSVLSPSEFLNSTCCLMALAAVSVSIEPSWFRGQARHVSVRFCATCWGTQFPPEPSHSRRIVNPLEKDFAFSMRFMASPVHTLYICNLQPSALHMFYNKQVQSPSPRKHRHPLRLMIVAEVSAIRDHRGHR